MSPPDAFGTRMSALTLALRIRVEHWSDHPIEADMISSQLDSSGLAQCGLPPCKENEMRNIMKIATRAFAVLAITGAAACGGSDEGGAGPSSPAPASDATGTYSLTQVRTLGNLGGGGSGLPVTFIDGSGDELVFLDGTLTLGTDGRFDMKVHTTFRGNPATLTDYGTYSVSGGSVTFSSEKSTPRLSTGSVSGNTITAHSQFGGIPFEIDMVK